MAEKSVAIRLGTVGKAQVANDFGDIGSAAEASAKRWTSAYNRAGQDAEAALARQAQAAAKLAAVFPVQQTQLSPARLDSFAGANDNVGKSAENSASIFEAAYARMEERAHLLRAAIDPVYAAQQRYNTVIAEARTLLDQEVLSVEGFNQIERAQALAVQQAAESIDNYTQRAHLLLTAIDPVYAAQQRFNATVAEARTLYAAEAISADQLALAEKKAAAALNDVVAAHGRAGVSTGQLRAGSQQLAYQISDVATSFAGGINPMVIFAQQGSQVVQAIGLMKGESAGLIGFLSGPWGAVVLGAVSILGVLGAKYFESANASDVLKEHQQDLGKYIDETTGKIKEQSVALLLNQAIQKQGDAKAASLQVSSIKSQLSEFRNSTVLSGTTNGLNGPVRIEQDPRIAAAIREFDRNPNADTLSARLRDIVKANPGLKETADRITGLAASYVEAHRKVQQNEAAARVLSGTAQPGDRRKAIGQFGPEAPDLSLVDAQAKLAAATTKQEKASAQAAIQQIQTRKAYDEGTIGITEYAKRITEAFKLVNDAKDHTDKHTVSLGRQAAALTINAQAGLDLARAYLEGGDAALKAEAARKGLTDATRKGIDGEAQVRRQLQIVIADQLVQDAKAVATLREQTAAQHSVNEQIANGTLSTTDANRALADEAALRPLLKLQLVAEGEARDLLTRTITEYRVALAAAHAEQDKFSAKKAIQDAEDRVEEIKGQIADLSKDPATRELNAADRAARRQANDLHLTGEERVTFLEAQGKKAKAEVNLRRASFADSTYRQQSDALELTQREAELVGVSADRRELILGRLRREQEIKRQLGSLDSDAAQQLLLQGDALDTNNLKLEVMSRNWDELKQYGDSFVDTVFNPDNWNNFGDLGKKVLKDLEAELIKLALLNPLKNFLFGENNPTLGGVLDQAGKTGGGDGGIFSGIGKFFKSIFHFASGTEYAPGGYSLVGENGPEIAYIPGGSRITPAGETRRLLSGSGGATVNYHFDMTNSIIDSDLWAKIESKIAASEQRATDAGAQKGFKMNRDYAQRNLGRAA